MLLCRKLVLILSSKEKRLSFKTNSVINLSCAIILFIILQFIKSSLLTYHFSDSENFTPCFFDFFGFMTFFLVILVSAIRTDVVYYAKKSEFNKPVAIVKDGIMIVLFLINVIVWW